MNFSNINKKELKKFIDKKQNASTSMRREQTVAVGDILAPG